MPGSLILSYIRGPTLALACEACGRCALLSEKAYGGTATRS